MVRVPGMAIDVGGHGLVQQARAHPHQNGDLEDFLPVRLELDGAANPSEMFAVMMVCVDGSAMHVGRRPFVDFRDLQQVDGERLLRGIEGH